MNNSRNRGENRGRGKRKPPHPERTQPTPERGSSLENAINVENVAIANQQLFNDLEKTMSFLGLAASGSKEPEYLVHSAAYETWLDISTQVNDQALMLQSAELLAASVWTSEQQQTAERLVVTTAPFAVQLRTVMDSYAAVNPQMQNPQIITHFCSQQLTPEVPSAIAQAQTHDGAVADVHSPTVFGLFARLAKRLQTEKLKEKKNEKLRQSLQAWEFSQSAQIPASITLYDPMNHKNSDTVEHWYALAKKEVQNGVTLEAKGAAMQPLKLSRKQTERLLGELEFRRYQLELPPMAEKNRELLTAYETLERFISSTLVYYDANQPELLAGIDLFSQRPKDAEAIFESLEVLKNHDAHTLRLFVEMCGHNLTPGGKKVSRFFGSALHVMLYNTQKTLNSLPATKAEKAGKHTAMKALFAELFITEKLDEADRKQLSARGLEFLAKQAAENFPAAMAAHVDAARARDKELDPEAEKKPWRK